MAVAMFPLHDFTTQWSYFMNQIEIAANPFSTTCSTPYAPPSGDDGRETLVKHWDKIPEAPG
jgi:hypothetical protein